MLASATARAQPVCAPIAGGAPQLGEVDARERLAFVREVLRDQARRTRTWMWSWGLGGIALSAGNFGFAALAPAGSQTRADSIVGGITSLVIPTAILIKPLSAPRDHEALESLLAQPADLCTQLAHAESALQHSAANEAEGVGLIPHAIALGGNAAIGLVLGLGYHHWQGMVLNGVGGMIISEIQIFTQPTGALRALAHYRQGTLAPVVLSWGVTPFVAEVDGLAPGLAITGTF